MMSIKGRGWRAWAAALIASAAVACDGNPARPTPGDRFAIACPAPLTVQSLQGAAVAVQFPAPTVTGGSEPVTTTCTPQSGSTFVVGTTSVACTARDARQQSVSCGFQIAVVVPPKLAATRFLAFGDSITAGVIPTTCSLGTPPVSRCSTALTPLTLARLMPLTPADRRLDIQQLRADLNASSASYPLKLQALLASRFNVQPILVVNEGEPGETAAEGVGRLPQALSSHAPEVLLLMEGVNDIHRPGDQAASVGPLVQALRTMTREARSRGARVFLGTLLPEDRCGCRAFDFVDGRDDIATANSQIRAMAAVEGAILVDLYQGFAGQTSTLLSFDGLHPNETGYAKMAEMFYDAIRQQLETLH